MCYPAERFGLVIVLDQTLESSRHHLESSKSNHTLDVELWNKLNCMRDGVGGILVLQVNSSTFGSVGDELLLVRMCSKIQPGGKPPQVTIFRKCIGDPSNDCSMNWS